ncbi:MAG: DUF2344 domain-containing protein [Lachnospiraceae bacterium]|nr:DUF2344 domain-containing protein [Lachnospiraceae bacterium]
MKKQLIFYKGGRLRFVGHLDMMRTMHRAMTRADIPLSYSRGFNPHPHMSFSSPLALGCIGEREIMEFRLEKDMEDSLILEQLNAQLPQGLYVRGVRTLEEPSTPIMALVRVNEYRILFPEDLPAMEVFEQLTSQPEITITKLGKIHGRKQQIRVDIKPLIESYHWENPHTLVLLAAGGSETNLKPELLLEQLYILMGCPERQHEESISRSRAFGRTEEGALYDLTDISSWECTASWQP